MQFINFGLCYDRGIGTKKDKTNAFEHFKTAADDGLIDAYFHLGLCYASTGHETLLNEAFRLYKAGADQGEPNCQCAVGCAYHLGKGTCGYEAW